MLCPPPPPPPPPALKILDNCLRAHDLKVFVRAYWLRSAIWAYVRFPL